MSVEIVKHEDIFKILEKIHEYHAAALKYGTATILCALAIGELLIILKSKTTHGAFTKIKSQVKIPIRTLNNYMRLASAFKEKLGQKISLDKQAFINSEMPDDIAKVVDGRTLTQLYNDWGILKKSNHIKVQVPGEKPKKISKAKQEEFERDLTRQAWDIILRKLDGEMEKLSFMQLAVTEREAILSCLDDARKEIARSIK